MEEDQILGQSHQHQEIDPDQERQAEYLLPKRLHWQNKDQQKQRNLLNQANCLKLKQNQQQSPKNCLYSQ